MDDEETARKSIAELLGGEDVAITAVGSSEAALEALEADRFDCIVLDLKLPKMSGFDLLEQLGGDERLKDIPVIVHTGQGADEAPGDEAPPLREDDRGEGRALAGAARGGDVAVPAPARVRARRRAAPPARAGAHSGRRLRREEGPGRGRRRPQPVRARQRARGARHGGAVRRERPRGPRLPRARTRTWTWC